MFTYSTQIALGILVSSGALLLPVIAQEPAAGTSALKPLVYKGCFTSGKPMIDQGSWTYQSPGYCQKTCVDLNKPVMGTTMGSNCWCGSLLPPANSKVSDSQCNSPCNGYDKNMCGGTDAWSVQLTGLTATVANSGDSSNSDDTDDSSPAKASDSSSPGTTSSPSPPKKVVPSVVTQAGTVKTVTAAAAPADNTGSASSVTSEKKDGGPNKAAIAAGVVVGLVIVGAIIGVLIFFLRRRKQQAVEEEYRQNTANTYIGGAGKTIPTSASSVSDSRLEPSVMMQRRQSDGSIADNHDYSRRILKVTNPDGPT